MDSSATTDTAHAPETGRLRLATDADIPALEALIPQSVRGLQGCHYSAAQREAALGSVFAVDRQLIRDGTYFVVEQDGLLRGAGGWSRRRALCGGDSGRLQDDELLDPGKDAARIRAFFVHPDWARRGIGRRLLRACEDALVAAGFRSVEILATLPGEPLYRSHGYAVSDRRDLPLRDGLFLPVVRMTRTLVV
ncbi:MAG: GNAT family N-acetyltransferase [Verrucomicrobiales bacterium]|nr:GNAT family N-acetyltransferase [Verrucomicrobiales bacterium]